MRAARCAQRAESPLFAPMVGAFSDSTWDPPGVWKLASVLAWQVLWVEYRELDVFQLGEPTTKAVELTCPRCRTRTTWKAKTLAARVIADPEAAGSTHATARFLVPDLGRRWLPERPPAEQSVGGATASGTRRRTRSGPA